MANQNHHFLGWDYDVGFGTGTFNGQSLIHHIGYFAIDGDIRGLHYGQIVQAAYAMSQIPHPEGHGNVFQDALNNRGQKYEPDRTYFKQFYIKEENNTIRLYVPPEEAEHHSEVLAPAA